MNLGLIGLGTMGGPMLRRLHQAGTLPSASTSTTRRALLWCDEVPTPA